MDISSSVFLCVLTVCYLGVPVHSYAGPRDFLGVTALPREAVVQGDKARFVFNLTPWPIPCFVDSCQSRFNVTLTMTLTNYTEGLTRGRPLCSIIYYQGIYDNTTGICPETTPRLLTYDPGEVARGVAFTLRNVTLSDEGQYGLLVHYGNITNVTMTTLTVLVPPPAPTITSSHDVTDAHVGDNVTLTCNVTGAKPPATLAWSQGVDWIALPENRGHTALNYSDTSWSVVTWRVTHRDHSAPYTCMAENEAGKTHRTVTLNVKYLPQVHLLPCREAHIRYYLLEDEVAILTCQADANPEVTSYTWYQSDKNDPTTATPMELSPNQTLFSPDNLSQGALPHYWCSAQNAVGASERVGCTIDVQYGPTVNIPPSFSLDLGEDAFVICSARARPNVTSYEWRKHGDPDFSVKSRELNLTNAQPEDAGNYTCHVSNVVTSTTRGKVTMWSSGVTEVKVIYGPRWTPFAHHKFAGHAGKPATLVCDVTGFPEVTFSWSVNGHPIDGATPGLVARGRELTVTSVEGGTWRPYVCEASNSAGTESYTLTLQQPGLPDPPHNCSVATVADKEVNLLCAAGYDGGYDVTYSISITRLVTRGHGSTEPTIPYQANATHGENKQSPGDRTGVRQLGLALGGPSARGVGVQVLVWVHQLTVTLKVTGLIRGTSYRLGVTTESSAGRSAVTMVVATTSGDPPPPSIRPAPPSLGHIIGVVLTVCTVGLILVAIATWQIVRWRKREDRYHSNDLRERLYRENSKQYDIMDSTTDVREDGDDITEYDIRHTDIKSAEFEQLAPPGGDVHNRLEPEVTCNGHVGRHNLKLEKYDQELSQSGMGKESRDANMNQWAGTCEVSRDSVDLRERLGDGSSLWGEVWRARVQGLNGRHGNSVAAAIILPLDTGAPKRRKLLIHQVAVMLKLDPHPHVLRLLGGCTRTEPELLLMEYACAGSLVRVLRAARGDDVTVTSRDQLTWALHVATGLEYLTAQGLMQRDLAARTVMVCERAVCKLREVGGSAAQIVRQREEERVTTGLLPFRWMAPETLRDVTMTSSSDVWAYGILLWEIVTFGATPYPGFSGNDVIKMTSQGMCMDKPRMCSSTIYTLMQQCWQLDPLQRLTFTQIRRHLEEALHKPDTETETRVINNSLPEIIDSAPGERV